MTASFFAGQFAAHVQSICLQDVSDAVYAHGDAHGDGKMSLLLPPPATVFFCDCDDCIYQNNWATADKITKSIAAYTAKIGVSKEHAYDLYKTHGTCLKGLLVEGRIDDKGVEEFLHTVHLIDYSDIHPDPRLRDELARLSVPSFIFTASASEHALRCMDRVGVKDLPWKGVIDTRSTKLESKHARSSFEAAMGIAGVTEPRACVFADDSVKNIKAAKEVGWRTVLVGRYDRDSGATIVCPEADAHIDSLHDLRAVMPELF
jgi:putative hydrolase of the HAD superfamily/pyrimidine and pyridine-specific 5'-nucleotidase